MTAIDVLIAEVYSNEATSWVLAESDMATRRVHIVSVDCT